MRRQERARRYYREHKNDPDFTLKRRISAKAQNLRIRANLQAIRDRVQLEEKRT